MPSGKKRKYLYATDRSPYWQFRFTINGREYRGSTKCKEAKDASEYVERERVAIRREIADSLKEASHVRGGRRQVTLAQCLDTFEAEKGRQWKSLRDKQRYADYLLNLGSGNDMLIADLTIAHLVKYRMQRTSMLTGPKGNRRNVSDATVNREIAHIQAAVNNLKGRGFELPELRWGDAKEHDAENKRVRCLSEAEEKRLMEALTERKPDLIPLVLFSIMTGQRKAATINLCWDRVDFDAQVATVELKGKGRKARLHQFPLTAEAVELVKAQPKVAGCPFVFTYECEKDTVSRTGEWRYRGQRYPFTSNGWTKSWLSALRKAELDDFRFHDLRHTTATRLIRAGANIQLVQNLLGHTQIQTTARYVNQGMDDLRQMMEMAGRRAKIQLVASSGTQGRHT